MTASIEQEYMTDGVTYGGLTTSVTFPLKWITACAAISILLRIRFIFTPLTADEGGFDAIARAWSHGKVLYSDVWVDRPQGLLVLFRIWDGNVRVLAIIFGVIAVYGAAIIAYSLANSTAAILAALFTAVLSSAVALEGFIANGELLSAAPSVMCLAIGCLVITHRISTRWMFIAGLCAGIAMSIKQSGYDGLLALGAWLVLAIIFEWENRRVALRWIGLLVGGFLSVWAVLALHGALTGWDNWLYAVGGYRFEGRSALEGANWPRFWRVMHETRAILFPAIIAGLCALLSLRGWANRYAILPLWLLSGTAAFMTGGQFYQHYWVTLTFPIAVTSAILVSSIQMPLRIWAIALVLVPTLISTAKLTFIPRDEVPVAVTGYARSIKEEKVGQWFKENSQQGDSLYVMCASAAAYDYAKADPPYPYLWLDNVNTAHHAQDRLHDMFATNPPTYVALFQSPTSCGLTIDIIDSKYDRVTEIEGVPIMIRRQS